MKFVLCLVAVLAVASAADKKEKRGLLGLNYGYNGLASGWSGLESGWTGSLGGLALDGEINAYSAPVLSSGYSSPILSKSKIISAAPIDAPIAAPIAASYAAPIAGPVGKSYGASIVSDGLLNSYSAPIDAPLVSKSIVSSPVVSKTYGTAAPLGLSGYSGLSGISGLSLGQGWGSDLSLGHGVSSW